MQDQVEALAARGLATGWRWSTRSRTATANDAALGARRPGELQLLYVAPERFAAARLPRRGCARPTSGCSSSTRRTASPSGATISAPTTSGSADAARQLGARRDRRLHRHRHAAGGGATSSSGSRCATRCGCPPGFDRPNIASRWRGRRRHEKRALAGRGAARGEDALPAIVYAGTRAGAEEIAARADARSSGEEASAYHAGLDRETRADVQRRFLSDEVRGDRARPTRSGWAWTSRTCAPWCTRACPSSLEAYYQEAGRAGRDGAPARALLLAENRDKALHVHFIKRDEIDPGLPGMAVGTGCDGARPTATSRYAIPTAPSSCAACGGDGERLRALIGHLTRAGVIAPSPSSPDYIDGRIAGRVRRRARRRSAGHRSRRPHGALAPVPGDLGVRRGRRCRRRAILRHFGDRRADARPRRVLRRLRPRRWSSRRRRRDRSRSRTSTTRSSRWPAARRPSVGRTTCAEILHGSRSKKIQRNSYDGLPAYGVSAHMRARRHPRARGRADRGGQARRRRAAPIRCCASPAA